MGKKLNELKQELLRIKDRVITVRKFRPISKSYSDYECGIDACLSLIEGIEKRTQSKPLREGSTKGNCKKGTRTKGRQAPPPPPPHPPPRLMKGGTVPTPPPLIIIKEVASQPPPTWEPPVKTKRKQH